MRIPGSKVHRPQLGVSVIDRTWLLERSPSGLPPGAAGDRQPPQADESAVTLLSAPAGAGKTTLMSSWADKRAALGERVTWVTLDAHDNDRVLFWSGLLAATRDSVDRQPGNSPAPTAIVLSGEQLADRQPLVQLEALVAAADGPVWLFLDDLQEIHAPDVLADVEALFRASPVGLRLVVATRRDPPVGLHRLQLSGRLREIRAADLALDRGEVRQLLGHHGVVLDEPHLSLLIERTEGWATGVRLAAMNLSRTADPQTAVEEFAGDERAVAEYLAAEILGDLGDVERALLRDCAVPDQLTVDLAVALTGADAAGTLLERLHRDNVLVLRTSGRGPWYRLHGLLRGYLVTELRRTDPQRLSAVHARTARWLIAHGHVASALTHAVAAGERDLAVEMLTGHGATLLAEGRARVLHRILASADTSLLGEPGVRQLAALVDLGLGQPSGGLPRPRTASDDDGGGATAPFPADPRRAALDALVTLRRAATADPGLSTIALAVSDPSTHDQPGDLALLTRQSRGILLTVVARLDEAEAEFEAAHRLATDSGNPYALLHATCGLTAVASYRCDFAGAWRLAEQSLVLAGDQGLVPSPVSAYALLQAAYAAYQQLDTAAAHDLTEQLLGQVRVLSEPVLCMAGTALLATMDVRAGNDAMAAARRLRDCWSVAGGQPMSAFVAARVAFAQHRCSWLVGRPEWAQEALTRVAEQIGPGGEHEVLAATEHLARGRAAAARRRLAPVLDGSVGCLLPTTLQQALLIEAVLADAADERAHAHSALNRALAIAEETAAMRAFLDVPGVPRLLAHDSGRFGRLGPLADRLRRDARAQTDHASPPLTPKELELLSDLPALLTLEEIADRHQVSVNTVKTHVRSIYQKLGAGSRREALATARHRGLL